MAARSGEQAPACVRCRTPYGLAYQSARVAGLAAPRRGGAAAGGVGGDDVPFCQACWKRVLVARRVRAIATIFGALVLCGGMVFAQFTRSAAPLLIAFGVAALALLGSVLFSRSARARKG